MPESANFDADPMIKPSPWWTKHRHQDRRGFLAARARIKAGLRNWFESQGFVEVETTCLVRSPGNEKHLHAFATERIGTDLRRERMYLHTSPEFAMKKLLAAGEEKIFTFAPVFRNREHGALHSPEFTMLEWYRAGEPYEALWTDCAEILKIAAGAARRTEWQYRTSSCDVAAPYRSLTVDRAFAEYAGIALHETYDEHGPNREALARLVEKEGISIAADATWSDIFSHVLVERIDSHLGRERADILYEYPACEAALARRRSDRPAVAERFELFVCGVELANGFGELTDASLQRETLEAEMQERQRIYGERYPLDEEFLAALAHMGPASGCALGFDRLVMLATGATSIDQVIWTPMADL